MARLIGPSEASREVKTIDSSGRFSAKRNRSATFYTDAAATVLADILTYPGGVAYTGSVVTIDAYSMLPVFQFPDGVDTLYVVVDGGPAWPVYAREDDRLDSLATRVAAVEAGGSGDTLLVHKAGAETIAGVKTFSAEPAVPTPTVGASPTTKTYVDAADALLTPLTRSVSTSAPLTGGGTLATDRTLTVSGATTGAVGVVQLAGDLAGTATAPVIATGAVTSAKIADGAIVDDDINASAGIAQSKISGLVAALAAIWTYITDLAVTVATKVAKGDININVADYIDRTGVANGDAGLLTAIAAAGATGTLHWPSGTYTLTTPVVIPCNVTSSPDAVISYTGTGTAVTCGTLTSGATVQRKRMALPQVVNAAKTTTGWAQTNVTGTVGVRLSNLNRSIVDISRIQSFETGLLLYGTGQGCAYVTANLGHLDNNKVNLKLDKDATGWCNSNKLVGGSCSHNSGEGLAAPGTKHVYLVHSSGNGDPNANTFDTISFETSGVVETGLDVSGSYNLFENCRYEVSTGTLKVTWQATAARNWILGGYGVDALEETFVSGQTLNSIIGTSHSRFMSGLQSGVEFENGGSSAYAALTVLRAGGTAAGDNPITAYTGRWQSTGFALKRFGDAFNRVFIDSSNGKIQLGSGTADPAVQWSQGAGSPEGVVTAAVGSIYSRNNGSSGTTVYVKESGSGNTGWVAPITASAAASADVQTFVASGTWTKPANAKSVQVEMVGGGGGGGSGARRAAGVLATGGAGGGAGGALNWTFDAANLPSTVTITVGAGGAAGAAVTGDDTNGNAGSAGTSSIFGSFARAWHGAAGPGGTSTGAATGGAGNLGTSLGGAGGTSSATGGVGATPSVAAGPPGGGAGGGITTGNVAANGGAGQTAWSSPAGATAGAAGVVDTTTPTGGGSVTTGYPLPGGSGGGGAASTTTAAQDAAAPGNYGAGGSGGGAARNGNNSGAGSAGAPGIVRVTTYF